MSKRSTHSINKTRNFHIHIEIKPLLKLNDQQLGKMVTHPDGIEEARKDLAAMLARGQEVLLCDKSCDNRDSRGACKGHEVD
ncbi:hypothetical protein [Vibrio fluvialis]|uniref:hypothetical protein n=1 Tax=Vibrio fluvialis TaxID=676 RepID=UPI00399B3B3B